MNSRGFTLIELVIAMSLISVIVAVTVGTLMTLQSSKRSIMQGADCSQQSRILIERFQSEINGVPSADTGRYFFNGDTNSLSFTSQSSFEQPGVPSLVNYRLNRVNDSQMLTIYGNDGNLLIQPIKLKLWDVSFRFYDGRDWVERWAKEVSYPPTAIEVRIACDKPERSDKTYRKVIGVLK